MKYKFTTDVINIKEHDQDIILRWPMGQEITIQVRTSNADEGGYAGSLDIILPDDALVTTWEGDEMKPSAAPDARHPEIRLAKQLVLSMDDSWFSTQVRKEN